MFSHGIMRDETALGEELDGAQWGDYFERIDGYQTNSGNVSAEEDEVGGIAVDKYFGALSPLSASSLRRNKNSGVATLPYKKATCYGFCPTDETESLKAIKCKCKQIIKVVGYGHHMRLRHGYRPPMGSSASNSGDDCQDFLLSPPHLPMLASTSNIPNAEFCDNSPPPSPSRQSTSAAACLDLTGVNSAEAEGRISSPPYYVEHCNDLVLVMKRSPHKSMSEKASSQSRDEIISGKDLTLKVSKQLNEKPPQLDYRTPQRRKRKGRKKLDAKELDEKELPTRSSVDEESVSLSSKLHYGEAGSPSSFGEFMEKEFMTSNRDDVLGPDDASRSCIDSAEALVDSRHSNVNVCSIKFPTSGKRKLLTSSHPTQQSRKPAKTPKTVKQELREEKAVNAPRNENNVASSSQKDTNEPKDLTKTVISQLLHFPGLSMTALTSDGKSSPLKPMLTSFSSPDLLSGAKRHLSSDGFTSDYREIMLREMDAKNILKISNRRTHLEGGALRGQLVKSQHASCSLPLSPSSESNSSSSVSDETSNLSVAIPESKCIELHMYKPGMDTSTTQMRTFLLRKAHEMKDDDRNLLHDESTSPVVTPISGDGTFFAFPSSISPSAQSSPSSLSSSISMCSSSSVSNLHSTLTPFFSNSQFQQQRVFQRRAATNFSTLSVQNKILNPMLRQTLKKSGNSSTESSASSNKRIIERPTTATQTSTKFVSVNMKSSTNDGVMRKPFTSGISSKHSSGRTSNGSPSELHSFKANTSSASTPLLSATDSGVYSKDKPLASKIYENADLSASYLAQQQNRTKLLQNASMLRRQVFVPANERLPQNFQRNAQNVRGVSTEMETSHQVIFPKEEAVSANENDGSLKIPISVPLSPNPNALITRQQQLDNLEQRHQRQMMMRAVQATGGAAGVFKEKGGNFEGQLRNKKVNTVISPRTLAQKRTLNQGEGGQMVNGDGKFHPNPGVQVNNNFSQLMSQPSLIKKFRPIIPRQSTSTNSTMATSQALDQRNGIYYQNNSQYGVYLAANKGNNSQFTGGLYSSEAGLSLNSLPLSTTAKMESNKYPQKLLPKMPTYRPIAQKRVANFQQQQQVGFVGGLAQTPARYGSSSSTSDDVVCLSSPFAHHINNIANSGVSSSNSEFSNGNEPFNDQQNEMNIHYGARRIFPGGSANDKIIMTQTQPQYTHMVHQEQGFERVDNFSPSRVTKHRRSPSSAQLLVLHQNNNVSGVESGSVGMVQFQNIEPPPILEAEGRIPVPGSNAFTSRQNPQQNSYEIAKPNAFVHQKQNLHHVQVIHRQPNQLQSYLHAQRSAMQPHAAAHHPQNHQRYASAAVPHHYSPQQQHQQYYQPTNAAHLPYDNVPHVQQQHYYHHQPQHFAGHREQLQQPPSHHVLQQIVATPMHPASGIEDEHCDENA